MILRTMLDGMRARVASAQLQVQAQIEAGPLQVDGDERRLQQLLGNLLENTLHYADAGGTVQLRCVRHGALLELVVEGSAPGVEADKHARLFERFHRTEASRNRASGGSGLGLAICRNIAEAHGGAINAQACALGG
nr:ATP-binding protein [Xanthomonas oryzae]